MQIYIVHYPTIVINVEMIGTCSFNQETLGSPEKITLNLSAYRTLEYNPASLPLFTFPPSHNH